MANIQIMRDSFAAQFKTEDEKIIYRKYGTGLGVEVSPTEHDQFLRQFNKSLYRNLFMMCAFVGIYYSGIAVLLLNYDISTDWLNAMLLIPTFFMLVLFVLSINRAVAAPARQLANRLPSASLLTPLERRRQWLRERDWSTFALGPAGALLVGYESKFYEAPFALNNIFWTAMVAAILGLFGVQAVWKWRIEREDRADHSG